MVPAYILSMIVSLVSVVSVQAGTSSAADPAFTPLVDHLYTYPNFPYQVDPIIGDSERGPQNGYNICNSTTQNQNSLCQTTMLNSLDDFCLWGPAVPNATISDTEGQTVAWCTKPGHGTRVIPAGSITAAQFLRAPGYVQVTGLINQININIQSDDGGGELDPHGADKRGNPLGGLFYSNAFPSNGGNNNSYQQVVEWHNFMGSNVFCIKACDPAVAGSAALCLNYYDRIGCDYNAPASYAPDEFTVCDSEDQDPPGVHTGSNGAVTTWSQPQDPTPAVPDYTARIPKTTNCVTYASASLYAAAASVTAPAATATGATSASVTGPASGTHSGASTTAKPSGSAASGSTKPTSASAAASASGTSNAAASSLSGTILSGSGGIVLALGMSVMAGLGAVVAAL